MNIWILFLVGGACVYLMKGLVPLLAAGREIPEGLVDLANLAPPAIAAAMVAGAFVEDVPAADMAWTGATVVLAAYLAARLRSAPAAVGVALLVTLVIGVAT